MPGNKNIGSNASVICCTDDMQNLPDEYITVPGIWIRNYLCLRERGWEQQPLKSLPIGLKLARDIKERINKWDYIKIKSFCMAKKISKMKWEPTVWENISANDTSDNSLISKIIKNSHNATPGRQTTQLKNGQRTWTDTSPRRTYRGPRDIWKDAQHH